jgi:hypothetical protein
MDGQVRKNVIGHLSLDRKEIAPYTNTFGLAVILNKPSMFAFMKTVSIFGENKDKNMLNSFVNNKMMTCTMMCMCSFIVLREG